MFFVLRNCHLKFNRENGDSIILLNEHSFAPLSTLLHCLLFISQKVNLLYSYFLFYVVQIDVKQKWEHYVDEFNDENDKRIFEKKVNLLNEILRNILNWHLNVGDLNFEGLFAKSMIIPVPIGSWTLIMWDKLWSYVVSLGSRNSCPK